MVKSIFSFVVFLLLAHGAVAQEAIPTNNVWTRMTMLQSEYGRGSTFSVDVDGREYWVTAKHMLTGAKHPPYGVVNASTVSLQLLDPAAEGERWVTVKFTVIDTERDVDIVVLAPPAPLLTNPLPSVPLSSDGMMFGGDCEFLGFPYGGGWKSKFDNGRSYWIPFMKRCSVSGGNNLPGTPVDETGGQKMWVLDGINNAGFSGGPVVFRTGPDQRILGVISGYEIEPTDVITSSAESKDSKLKKVKPKQTVNLNSGFVIAYDISYAVDAIHKHPLGPLRTVR